MIPEKLRAEYWKTAGDPLDDGGYIEWLESRCCDLTRYKEGMEKLEKRLKVNEEIRLQCRNGVAILLMREGAGGGIYLRSEPKRVTAPSLLACIESMEGK